MGAAGNKQPKKAKTAKGGKHVPSYLSETSSITAEQEIPKKKKWLFPVLIENRNEAHSFISIFFAVISLPVFAEVALATRLYWFWSDLIVVNE